MFCTVKKKEIKNLLTYYLFIYCRGEAEKQSNYSLQWLSSSHVMRTTGFSNFKLTLPERLVKAYIARSTLEFLMWRGLWGGACVAWESAFLWRSQVMLVLLVWELLSRDMANKLPSHLLFLLPGNFYPQIVLVTWLLASVYSSHFFSWHSLFLVYAVFS